jgi:hypothetical protein
MSIVKDAANARYLANIAGIVARLRNMDAETTLAALIFAMNKVLAEYCTGPDDLEKYIGHLNTHLREAYDIMRRHH